MEAKGDDGKMTDALEAREEIALKP